MLISYDRYYIYIATLLFTNIFALLMLINKNLPVCVW